MQHNPSQYTIYDAHCHIFPEKIAARATEAIGAFYGIPMQNPSGLGDDLLAEGGKIGVLRYLVCSSATTPAQVASINDFIARACALHPEFMGFGALHPDMDNAPAELERMQALGLRGVKLHPDFQKFQIDTPKAIELYRLCARLSLPVLFHTGDNRYDFSSPVRLRRALDAAPDMTAIAAHFGGYSQWEDSPVLKDYPQVYFDTSSSLFTLDKATAVDLIRSFGARRFMFGSDFPMWRADDEFARFMALDLTECERRQILSGTFASLFGQ